MTKQKIWKIISTLITVFCLIYGIYSIIEQNEIKQEYKSLYEKSCLTRKDIKTGSTFSTSVINNAVDYDGVEVRYKKLYGVEYVDSFKLGKEDGIAVKFLHGDPAKILILDEKGNERFYAEVSELDFEPGEAGEYDVYLVGNKFTGRIAFSTY